MASRTFIIHRLVDDKNSLYTVYVLLLTQNFFCRCISPSVKILILYEVACTNEYSTSPGLTENFKTIFPTHFEIFSRNYSFDQ